MTIEQDLKTELAALEAELVSLNQRRIDLYRRSIAAPETDKACHDVLANAMLSGPLQPSQMIQWPITVQNIGWNPDNAPVFSRSGPNPWVGVRHLLSEEQHMLLGIHLGDVATGIRAQVGKDDILHFTHIAHVPVIFVAQLRRLVLATESEWHRLESIDQIKQLDDYTDESVLHGFAEQDILAELAKN